MSSLGMALGGSGDVGAKGGSLAAGLLASLTQEEVFRPAALRTLADTDLPTSLIEQLACKYLSVSGTVTGHAIAKHLCLPFRILEGLLQTLRNKQLIVHTGSAALNDYYYALTEQGRERAHVWMSASAYAGALPVPLADYVVAMEAQTIRAEAPRRQDLEKAFADICVDPQLFEDLGPAVNSGAGLFLYGQPGNGKSTLAVRITQCFGQHIWIPYAIYEDGQIVKVFDAAHHVAIDEDEPAGPEHDRRWVKIRRPTVIVGGELTMDSLEIRHDPRGNVCEAPLQMKSNCGCLLIDDFGRQRIEPVELLNRWIIPLENRIDFLTLPTGKKIQVPFEQLIIFSTNLEPSQLVDEAFLRRIPYKIEIADPGEEEFHRLFMAYCRKYQCEYRREVIEYLLAKHYRGQHRGLRRCHPRDMLSQIRNYCRYNGRTLELRPEYFDRVVRSYFTVVTGVKS